MFTSDKKTGNFFLPWEILKSKNNSKKGKRKRKLINRYVSSLQKKKKNHQTHANSDLLNP